MTPEEVRKNLSESDADYLRSNAFELLRAIAQIRNDEDDKEIAQELILRALDRRDEFGPAAVILDGLVRDVGLFPYLDPDELSLADRIALEIHRPANLDSIVFHHPQAKVFQTLMSGKSVVLSAPTSFGKSLIIDAIVASRRFTNIVIVVPTLALIDETRRRLAKFRETYRIITQPYQPPGERNVFVLTQERVVENPHLDRVDFFVIDEFYKLSPSGRDLERCAMLNHAFYILSKKCKHFYLLGPGIDSVSEEFRHAVNFEFFHEPYHTVVSELHRVSPGQRPLERLRELAETLQDPTLVFCSSPDRAMAIADVLPQSTTQDDSLHDVADWIGKHYHADWHFVKALRRGVGIHHGRIPRALAQHIVNLFNEERLRFLVCTSTLIEGVNTKAKNIVVFDHKIKNRAIDLFTFNNIRGRSGRMFKHFVGHVYIFNDPPQSGLPEVDVPAFTQTAASDGLLVQLDEDDLTDASAARVDRLRAQRSLSFDVIRQNVGVDPEKQIELAEELASHPERYSETLAWSGVPKWNDLVSVCELIWSFFGGSTLGSGSARTPEQLAAMLMQLHKRKSMREFIAGQLRFVSNDADKAVRAVLDFHRLWATFHFPRLLRAVGRIQEDVFARHQLPYGKFEQYASLVEHLFLKPSIVALEEYGVPLPLGRKLERYLGANLDDLDSALLTIRELNLEELPLTPFERRLLSEAREGF